MLELLQSQQMGWGRHLVWQSALTTTRSLLGVQFRESILKVSVTEDPANGLRANICSEC